MQTFLWYNVYKIRMKSQSSTEFLVVMGSVILIVVLAATFFIDIPKLGSNPSQILSIEMLSQQPIGILFFAQSHNCTFIEVLNNQEFTVSLTNISLNTNTFTFTHFPKRLLPRESAVFFDCVYEAQQTEELFDVKVSYENYQTAETFLQTVQIQKEITLNEHFYDENRHLLPFVGPLDQIHSAVAAYATTKLRHDYTGPLFTVRRSSDNELFDVYSKPDGRVDIIALETFLGSSDGFVSVWYDQSYSGNDLVQEDHGFQPQIQVDTTAVIFFDTSVLFSQEPLFTNSEESLTYHIDMYSLDWGAIGLLGNYNHGTPQRGLVIHGIREENIRYMYGNGLEGVSFTAGRINRAVSHSFLSTWHSIIFTLDELDFSLFVDFDKLYDRDFSDMAQSNTNPLQVGRWATNLDGYYFVGWVDSIIILDEYSNQTTREILSQYSRSTTG